MTQAHPTPARVPAPRTAPAEIHAAAPALGWYSDNVLFGEVWERSELPKRDRSIATITTLITRGYTQQLTGHFNRALTNGVTPTEIVEIVTHLAFYAGWPCAMSAVGVMQQVFTARQVGAEQVRSSINEQLAMPDAAAIAGSTQLAPAFDELSARVIEGELWQRTELAARDRHLVTLVTLLAQGELDQLPAACARAMASGLRRHELGEVLTHLAFYLGWPRVQQAAQRLAQAA